MKYLLDNHTGIIAEPKTLFDIKIKDSIITAHFSALGSSLTSFSKLDNSDLWKDNVVEIFLDLGVEGFYYEFEIAPNGAKFVAKKYPNHLEYLPTDLIDTGVSIDGNTYSVELKMDLTKFPRYTYIRYNAFRIEKGTMLQALSPTYSDTFHVRDKFISL